MTVPEEIGKRIARLRQEYGWTQQTLAERLAVSRVAVSHIEMDISIPGERTIALLAGLFKLSPYELVAGTTYPQAKADRLPQTVCSYTALEQDMALLKNDLGWLERLAPLPQTTHFQQEVRDRWAARLADWERELLDEQQRAILLAAKQAFAAAIEGMR